MLTYCYLYLKNTILSKFTLNTQPTKIKKATYEWHTKITTEPQETKNRSDQSNDQIQNNLCTKKKSDELKFINTIKKRLKFTSRVNIITINKTNLFPKITE